MGGKASAGRVGPGGVIRKTRCSQKAYIRRDSPPGPYRDQASRAHRGRSERIQKSNPPVLNPLGLDTSLSAGVGEDKQWVPKLIISRAPPDPTRPALTYKYADQPILNAPKSNSTRPNLAVVPHRSSWIRLRLNKSIGTSRMARSIFGAADRGNQNETERLSQAACP